MSKTIETILRGILVLSTLACAAVVGYGWHYVTNGIMNEDTKPLHAMALLVAILIIGQMIVVMTDIEGALYVHGLLNWLSMVSVAFRVATDGVQSKPIDGSWYTYGTLALLAIQSVGLTLLVIVIIRRKRGNGCNDGEFVDSCPRFNEYTM